MRRFHTVLLPLAAAAMLLTGCDAQESAKIQPAAPAAPADDPELRTARDEMIRVKVQLGAARNRNYELQQHVDDLEQQMTKFDEKGFAAKIQELQYRNAGLAKDVAELKKRLAGVRDGSID